MFILHGETAEMSRLQEFTMKKTFAWENSDYQSEKGFNSKLQDLEAGSIARFVVFI